MIIALDGRRVDAPDAQQLRFPPQNVGVVKRRIRALLEREGASILVSSAACGADLLALWEAARLGLRRRIVLPYDRERFRANSVTDRPGDWGLLYDQVLDDVDKNGDLLIIRTNYGDNPYAEANRVILDDALALARQLHDKVIAVLVWDGKSRGEGDVLTDFLTKARIECIRVVEVMTI
jgi:hypothetical protein